MGAFLGEAERASLLFPTHMHVPDHEGPPFLMDQVHIEVTDSPLFSVLKLSHL